MNIFPIIIYMKKQTPRDQDNPDGGQRREGDGRLKIKWDLEIQLVQCSMLS
jgi:hypothetical protein